MGNTTALVVLYTMISLVGLLMTVGIQSVDPNSNYLFSNYLFGSSDPVGSQMNSTTYTPNQLNAAAVSRETTGSNANNVGVTSTTIFPDWVYSGYQWAKNAGAFLLNLVGAPYTIALMFDNSAIAGIIGAAFSVINLFVVVNWLLGRDN